MSKKFTWNENWKFTKDAVTVSDKTTSAGNWETLDLPHTWNGEDGQDGGNDYYRGTCYYAKNLSKAEITEGKEVYIEFEAANSSAELFVNGESIAKHDGGYSTWRANITPYLKDENEIVVAVDNAPNDHVYPQNADFTFYGGLYRKVSLILVDETRFDLDYYGSPAIKVTPEVTGADAKITTEVYLTNATSAEELVFTITDGDTVVDTVTVSADKTEVEQTIANVHLWNGRKDPHLYTMHVELKKDGQVVDERTTRFGCRTFKVDPEKGFFLNGEHYPLRGVSRHQDRPHIGNALTPEMHEEDAKIIYELGATTIRLAHYQHDQHFYDMCDELGFVLWAEIPYISVHMPNGRENTISQMKELVVQNYNHASIFFWGLSNEITMKGAKDPDLLENHHILNDMVHEMDKTRLTTMAVISMCDISESQYIEIPDLVSYNQYLGWYGGKIEENGPFMDSFHEMYPNIPIGMSEYGAEAYKWHSSHPEQGDYSEEYQAHYHEELIKQLYTRDFVWATHVWNMF
ncbi:MAG: glycoside hydrolase family 2 protein, partial [Firmicutes bacterium]|nr:glycoside hydrolase family 2 protein [Bacillota bacterium]